MKAAIIFDTRYGNTGKVAASLGAGLESAGIEVSCLNVRDVRPSSLDQCDLICVGAPTEWRTAPKAMKEFLGRLDGHGLAGRFGFAFDTKLDRPLSGSAAKFIEKELESIGLQIVAPRESATVFLESGSTSGAWLKEGEEKRFEEAGARVGAALDAKRSATVA